MFAQHFCDPVRRRVLRASLARVLSAVASVSAFSQIRADPRVVAAAPPELLARVKATPFNYFRFVNKPWIEAVCRGLAEDVRRVPNVELHGDAHVEQFALTDNAYGLDDFDDSCRGPAFVDIIRFLGSVDLVSRQRGWTNRRDALFVRFFSAYRRGIAQPGYQPPEPAVVAVLRKRPTPSHEEFMAMGERLMEPMSPQDLTVAAAGLRAFTDLLRSQRPDLPPDFQSAVRQQTLSMLNRLEPRLRSETIRLVDQLITAWKELQ
jgi:hypothetical protein